jgi:hypothetical protein
MGQNPKEQKPSTVTVQYNLIQKNSVPVSEKFNLSPFTIYFLYIHYRLSDGVTIMLLTLKQLLNEQKIRIQLRNSIKSKYNT